MSIEENKALVRRVYDLCNRGEVKATYELYAPECVFHMADGDLSVEQIKQFDIMLYTAFPDAIFTIKDIVAEGDKVFIRVNMRATNTGEFMGNAPTRNKINITNAALIKIAAGKWSEYWSISDRLGMMQQLGVISEQ